MDEQTVMTSEPEQAYDAEADGLAYGDYGTSDYSEPVEPDEPVTSGDGNIMLNSDGELEFSEDYLSDMGNDAPEAPKMYTPEELQATPFEQWDINRLEGDVRDYVPIVRDQMMRRQMEQ